MFPELTDEGGGPAFPSSYNYDEPYSSPGEEGEIRPIVRATVTNLGLSTRDYFAAKAMQSILPAFMESVPDTGELTLGQYVAGQAYEMADAMLAARNSHKDEPR